MNFENEINVVSVEILDNKGRFVTYVDFWSPKGRIEMYNNSVIIDGKLTAFGYPLGKVKIS